MKYNEKNGQPHTFPIPDDIWADTKKLAKELGMDIQEFVLYAIMDRTEKLLNNQTKILVLSDKAKSRTYRIPQEQWKPFKDICGKQRLNLNREFIEALVEYAKRKRGDYTNVI